MTKTLKIGQIETDLFKLKERAPVAKVEQLEDTRSKGTSQYPAPEAKSAIAGNDLTDKEGLDNAYEQGDAYSHGDTLYVAGSWTSKDWYDHLTTVPFWGDLRNATRHQQAEKALKANPSIKNVVGHS
ncbi:MAG: hypothetical protein ACKO96_49440 [Flammeovirgaceae bacterium]